MSILSVIGNSMEALVEQRGSPSVMRGAGGVTRVVRTYRVSIGSLLGALPAYGTPDADYPQVKLREVVSRELKEYPTVELVYLADSTMPVQGRAYENQTIYSSSAAASEMPIEQHPDYVADWATTKPGVTSYVSPQPTWTRVTYVAQSSIDEASVIANVAKRCTAAFPPAGLLDVADYGRWLKMSKSMRSHGTLVEITEVWQYYYKGWDRDIYPEAS